jgi:hypothetical protein
MAQPILQAVDNFFTRSFAGLAKRNRDGFHDEIGQVSDFITLPILQRSMIDFGATLRQAIVIALRIHSALMPAALMIGHHLSISAL